MMRAILFIAVLLLPLPLSAQAKPLQMDLANDRVNITTGFNGTDVVLFGTTEGAAGANVLVTLKGPERTMIVREKARSLLGTWMNSESTEFRRVPSYYDYAAAGPVNALPPALLDENQIGVDHLGFYSEDADEEPAKIEMFRDSLTRLMQQKGFYAIKPRPMNFIADNFFKVTFELPPGVPTGIYTAEAIVVRDGVVLSRESKTLRVGQVGFNARVYLFAQNHAVFYGIFSVLLALVSGWSAFTFLRRD